MKELQEIIRVFGARHGEPFALATLVRARGSSYRRPGARMLIGNDRLTVGSLSGGCLEEEVALLAQEVIASDEPKLLPFDMRRRFGCNGEIEIFIERLNPDFVVDLAQHFQVRRTCVAITKFTGSDIGSRIAPADHERVVEFSLSDAFVQRIDPPIRLVVIGSGHDTVPLQPLCELLGWKFVAAATITDAPENLDAWTAALVKTHNYGRDFAALQKLVPLGLPYLGLIGPRRRRDQLLADLCDITGPIDAELFAPAGLDLGAEAPEEIALAVIAEIQSIFAAASCESLRDRKAPIHPIVYDLPESADALR